MKIHTLLATLCLTSSTLAWKPAPGPLQTKWTADVNPSAPLPEYPRPQLVRAKWQNLNGLWKYSLTDKAATTPPTTFNDEILVPFPYESSLSGVGKPCIPDQRLWYRQTFTLPVDWKDQDVLLHFGAVTWQCTVSVNGKPVGQHTGGYNAFSFDVTEHLRAGENELIVSAWNPVASDVPDAQVLGKQRQKPSGIFYTAATGIWQTVWLEPVPKVHITSIKITPDVDAKSVHLSAQISGSPTAVASVQIFDNEHALGELALVRGDAETTIPMPEPKLWTPEFPHLYTLKIQLRNSEKDRGGDTVTSYFAMRKISLGKDDKGQLKMMLNNQPVFQRGVLDQGYWPDGIYTAPTDAALKYDLEVTKELGFNMSRKHAKVEPDRWYYWADKLGVLVWQDMPQMFGKKGDLSATAKAQFEKEWREEMAQFHNHPSIIVWTTFNEGWGQHDTERVVALTKQLDPSRLVNNASGWTDMNCGDIHDTHAYPTPNCELPTPTRSSVCGEFGGLGMRVDGHMWSQSGWGYQGVYSRAYPLTKKYQQLLEVAWKLAAEKGMSGYVYTQLTDVEEESNGLLPYDRSSIKPDLAITRAANQGKFLPLPPNPHPDILPTSAEEPQTWRYTLDQPAENWAALAFDASAWKTGPGVFGKDVQSIGTPWETPDLYIRREFTLPDPVPANLVLNVLHDEDVEVYLNGVLAGKLPGFKGNYVPLVISAEARKSLHPGLNSLAAHCHQSIGGQGLDVGISTEP